MLFTSKNKSEVNLKGQRIQRFLRKNINHTERALKQDRSELIQNTCVRTFCEVLRKPIRDNPKIFTKSEKMFLKSEKIFQIVMFFGNRRRRVYQI